MNDLKTLDDFENVPKFWKEYISLTVVTLILVISVLSVQFFDKHWIATVASCVSLVCFIIQLQIASGSTNLNQCKEYKTYLATLQPKHILYIINEHSIDGKTQQFALDYVKSKKLRLTRFADV